MTFSGLFIFFLVLIVNALSVHVMWTPPFEFNYLNTKTNKLPFPVVSPHRRTPNSSISHLRWWSPFIGWSIADVPYRPLMPFIWSLPAYTNSKNQCSDRHAICMNIRDCSHFVKILNYSRPLSTQALQTIENTQCGYDGNDLMVCCVNQTSSTVTMTTTTTTTTTMKTTTMKEDQENIIAPQDVMNHPNLRLLDHQVCGPIMQQKVSGGSKTGIFQYPWMALIIYDTGRPNPEFRCSGTIISTRYILTAAHCVTMLPSNVKLIGVRVGDHDISKERECESDEGLEIQCAEKYQDFAVESFYFHPDYIRRTLQNDIALIKLNSSMNFRSRSVRPICLPFGTWSMLNHKKVIVTGWGATEYRPRSQALLQAKLSLTTNEKCKEMYKQIAQISYKQLCTISQNNIDFCLGDSGGPLQVPDIYNGTRIRMIQYGVTSYGLRQCGIEGFPGVSTKVAYYMKWILDNMTD